jgi:hypothetical protein
VAAHAEVLGARADTNRRERYFYIGMSVAILITVFVGFSRTFYVRPYFFPERLMPLLVVHGIVFSAWIALLITQIGLIAVKRLRTHMQLGIAGGVLAVLMIVIGTVTAIVRAKGPSPVPGFDALTFLTIPLGDMLVFAILVGAAFYFRRKPDTHKRLMLLSTITLLPAAVARLPFDFIQQAGPLAFFGLADLFVVPLFVYDLATRGRPHRATVLGSLLLIISHPFRIPIGTTQAWLAFATWITQWV